MDFEAIGTQIWINSKASNGNLFSSSWTKGRKYDMTVEIGGFCAIGNKILVFSGIGTKKVGFRVHESDYEDDEFGDLVILESGPPGKSLCESRTENLLSLV